MGDNYPVPIPVKYITAEGEVLRTDVWNLAHKYALGYESADGDQIIINVEPIAEWIHVVVSEQYEHEFKKAQSDG
jgi:hypothetical protein